MEAKVKDFIIDLSALDIAKNDDKKKTNSIPKVEYELVLENDMDFVIKRKTTKTDKDLVFLVSQDLYYIRDNKTEQIAQLNDLNVKRQIGTFTRDMDKWVEFEKVQWTKNCYTENLYNMFKNPRKRKFIKNGFKNVSSWEMEKTEKYLDKNSKLFRYYYNKMNNNIGGFHILNAVFYIEQEFNYNNAKYLVDILADLNIKNGDYFDEMCALLKLYSFDTNTFLQYITYGLKAQGIESIYSDVYANYRDYLKMTQDMYGKIKNKYPKYLKTEHDKVVMKYNLYKKYKEDLAVFNITQEHRDLEYKDKTYSIVLPETSADIIDEGVNQSNCVASYVEKIVVGDTMICFMRLTDDLENSLVTVEVNRKGEVCQVKGFANRDTTREEDVFIKKWAKSKELKVTYKKIK